jgi:hypothetical protein
MKKFQWQIPYFIGILIGVMLWASNGFDIASTIAQWGLIAAALILYFLVMRGVPIQEKTDEPAK